MGKWPRARRRIPVLIPALALAMALALAACGGGGAGEADALAQDVRGAYLAMAGCQAHMEVTADYGRRVFTYGAQLTWRREGESVLTLTAPESVAGASAVIAEGGTALEYQGVMVETGPLDAAGLTPIDAVPALLAWAREGFIAESALEEGDGGRRLHLTCREPGLSPGQGREGELWFDAETFALVRGEIAQEGFTVIQCEFTDFTMTGAAG